MIDIRDLSKKERQNLLKEGLQCLNDEIPEDWVDDPNTCPCVIECSCEGIKDSDYIGRCVNGKFGYQNCEIYEAWARGVEPSYEKPESRALKDTVIMHGDEIVNNKKTLEEGSVEDAVNEGIPISQFTGLSKSLRTSYKSSHTDHRWRIK